MATLTVRTTKSNRREYSSLASASREYMAPARMRVCKVVNRTRAVAQQRTFDVLRTLEDRRALRAGLDRAQHNGILRLRLVDVQQVRKPLQLVCGEGSHDCRGMIVRAAPTLVGYVRLVLLVLRKLQVSNGKNASDALEHLLLLRALTHEKPKKCATAR